MGEFLVSEDFRNREMEAARKRRITLDRLFVLLLGPSATGKSTIIDELKQLDSGYDFEYVKPIITRQNRPNETDKISVPDNKFDDMEADNKFVIVNRLYGVRYGTPLEGIISPLEVGKTPILDYPLETVGQLERPEYDLLRFYVYPSSLNEWTQRVDSSGRDTGGRLEAGKRELQGLQSVGLVHPSVDISIINGDGQANLAAMQIVSSLDSVLS